jgi:deoxyribose-phosphate aldolase
MINIKDISDVNDDNIESRILKITSHGLKNKSLSECLKSILGMIDLTILNGSDTDEKIINLCQTAHTYKDKGIDIPNVAAVCVYPPFVKKAKENLKNTDIKVASVAGAFPSGQSPLNVKLAEIKYAIDQGADEIDMVISRGKLLEKKYSVVFDEISAIRELCKDVHLKVIIETGELETLTNIKIASEIAVNAGADFLKTSTGKIPVSATEQAVLVMIDTIKDFYNKTGKIVGIKVAGGVSESFQALNYFMLVQNVLGDKWINKNYFRFGASRLANNILNDILKIK